VETFSLAALEAMAMSRPVVHADLGGASEMIVSGHNGYLFPVGDTASLVERLRQLADPVRAARLGGNARRRVEERFSETAMVTRYEQLLVELCRRYGAEHTPSIYQRQDRIGKGMT
jgi:glycosyltransferase involved in cell wall biosynthesis